jgi:hypothetical protein
LTDINLRLTSGDVEIPERVAKAYGLRGPYKYQDRTAEWVFCKPNTAKPHLEKWGLIGTDSFTKFIPSSYMLGSIDERFELLRGLMDTDGWADADGDCYFGTSSARLRDDVSALARSLGAIVTTREKHPRFQSGIGALAYTLRIKIRDPKRLFHLSRKQRLAREPQSMFRAIVGIEPSRKAEARCIAVSNPNGLYLTNDYIVTHNTDLLIGLALIDHQKSVIFRREGPQLAAIIERTKELVGNRPGLNESAGAWRRLPGGRTIEFGAMQLEDAKQNWQGRPHDFYGFDEIPQFTKSQYQFVIGWNRTSVAGQRCRVICAGNPPLDEAGDWVLDYWAPWLKETHPNPAMPGELRWFVKMADGEEVELLSGDPVDNGKEIIKPKSRTFIPASIEDNPVYRDAGYRDTINNLPEPLRSQLLGDFKAAKVENPYQVFPTAWLRAAQARWTPQKPDIPLSCLGNDGARGGSDKMVNAKRYANWLAPLSKYPGKEIPDGPTAVHMILKDIGSDMHCQVNIDVIGIGSSIYDHARGAKLQAFALSGAEKSEATDKSGKLGFVNMRAEQHWKFREALDPTSGQDIALPPDPELFADLCAPRWHVTPRGIAIEPKSCGKAASGANCCIKHRIGRSPDCGEACIYAFTRPGAALSQGAIVGTPRAQVVQSRPWPKVF